MILYDLFLILFSIIIIMGVDENIFIKVSQETEPLLDNKKPAKKKEKAT